MLFSSTASLPRWKRSPAVAFPCPQADVAQLWGNSSLLSLSGFTNIRRNGGTCTQMIASPFHLLSQVCYSPSQNRCSFRLGPGFSAICTAHRPAEPWPQLALRGWMRTRSKWGSRVERDWVTGEAFNGLPLLDSALLARALLTFHLCVQPLEPGCGRKPIRAQQIPTEAGFAPFQLAGNGGCCAPTPACCPQKSACLNSTSSAGLPDLGR